MATSSRTRLLLLPLLFGLLLLPAFLRTTTAPAATDPLHSDAMCSAIEEKEPNPHCLHCRAPMIDVPLARASDPPVGDAPPAA